MLRPAGSTDRPLLERILLEAYNWAGPRWTLEWVRTDAMARRYLDGFPAPGDVGLVAEVDGEPVGALWARPLPADRAGYGFVAPDIPELTLGVLPQARRRGVGTELLDGIVSLAGGRGLSLSVEDGNPARRLYERAGFRVVGRTGNSDTMLLTPPPHPR
jgi:GNAT superfamily N-acetyltransferase